MRDRLLGSQVSKARPGAPFGFTLWNVAGNASVVILAREFT